MSSKQTLLKCGGEIHIVVFLVLDLILVLVLVLLWGVRGASPMPKGDPCHLLC